MFCYFLSLNVITYAYYDFRFIINIIKRWTTSTQTEVKSTSTVGKFLHKPRRRTNYYNPTLASEHVEQILSPFASSSRSLAKEQSSRNMDALETARQDFQKKQLTNARAQSVLQKANSQQIDKSKEYPKSSNMLKNPLVHDYEIKRAAYRASLQNSLRGSHLQGQGLHLNNYNYSNDSTIYQKQAHNFNIISLLPQSKHNLRQYHKLTTQDKLGWRLDTGHVWPMTPSPNPEKH